jgi:hypothetical protein
MQIIDADGKPLRFANPSDERAWIRAHSGARPVAASGPPRQPTADSTNAAAERSAVKALILEAEAELGCPILDEDGTPYLRSARRRGLSGQEVARELGTFIARTMLAATKGGAVP